MLIEYYLMNWFVEKLISINLFSFYLYLIYNICLTWMLYYTWALIWWILNRSSDLLHHPNDSHHLIWTNFFLIRTHLNFIMIYYNGFSFIIVRSIECIKSFNQPLSINQSFSRHIIAVSNSKRMCHKVVVFLEMLLHYLQYNLDQIKTYSSFCFLYSYSCLYFFNVRHRLNYTRKSFVISIYFNFMNLIYSINIC